jgi:methylmalonyl-CoA/ethylmalonyl-CoA epimerase
MTMLNLHHIGIAVADIAQATETYVRTLGCEVKSQIIHDPVQTAYVQFLKLPGDSVYLEFVSPDGQGSKLAAAMKKGGGLNHLCYSVTDIEAACKHLRAQGLMQLQAPVPAVAFKGRQIAWLMGRDRVPVELVESGAPGEL